MCLFKKKLKNWHKKNCHKYQKKLKIKHYTISFNLNEPNINFI